MTTDYEQGVLDLAAWNVRQNDVEESVSVENLKWGEKSSTKYDFIIGSEVTYSDTEWDALITTILSAAKSTCRVIFSEAPRFISVCTRLNLMIAERIFIST